MNNSKSRIKDSRITTWKNIPRCCAYVKWNFLKTKNCAMIIGITFLVLRQYKINTYLYFSMKTKYPIKYLWSLIKFSKLGYKPILTWIARVWVKTIYSVHVDFFRKINQKLNL